MNASLTNPFVELSYEGESRFSVELTNAPILLCERIVRRVPNKRLVVQGVWRGKAVFAKLFLGKNALKYLTRDKHGIDLLTQAHIATPKVLYMGLSSDGNVHVLILEAIEASQNAEVAWQLLRSDDERLQLAKPLVAEVAKHHQAGLLQTDLYFKNFLIQANKVFTLDGDGIRHLSFMFKARQKRRNLATLFSKMDVLDDAWIPELFAYYCSQMAIRHSLSVEADIWFLTQKIRQDVTSSYADKKVFRNCTDVKVRQCFSCFSAIAMGFHQQDFSIEHLDSVLIDRDANLKNGNTCTIAKASIGDFIVVVKRYNIKNFWHGINRAFRITRAAKSWANAHRLIISGVATPKPIALVEARWGWLRRRAYFVSEYVDAPDALAYFSQTDNKWEAALAIATLFYKLYCLNITHGDCKSSNIKMLDGKPMLIDLDAMQAHRLSWLAQWWFNRQHVKDLKRLMKNWVNDAEVTALLKQAFDQKYNEHSPYEPNPLLYHAGLM